MSGAGCIVLTKGRQKGRKKGGKRSGKKEGEKGEGKKGEEKRWRKEGGGKSIYDSLCSCCRATAL